MSGPQPTGLSNPLADYHSIGIILAGGGAKGAYQAGALKAIHEFLTRHNAHEKVRMIAGTSIGSWNALFWLAGLVGTAETSSRIDLERWWSNLSVLGLVRPALYLPALRNYFLSPHPWRKSFQTIFLSDTEVEARLGRHIKSPDGKGSIHFYFTRSNVERARLEVTTNRPNLSELPANLPVRGWAHGVRRMDSHLAQNVEDLNTAVFSSMDLPPLFEYVRMGDQFYEDGGVIDNLPIQFGTEIEQCDLLFVLPLNATFSRNVNRRSIMRRLLRVMDVRQGVLERNSFKMIYLYNELAALRERTETLERLIRRAHHTLAQHNEDPALMNELANAGIHPLEIDRPDQANTADCALMRRHRRVQVFAVCPGPKLAVNTIDFWKRDAAAKAFRLMHQVTSTELDRFFARPPDLVRVALVQPQGEVAYLEEF